MLLTTTSMTSIQKLQNEVQQLKTRKDFSGALAAVKEALNTNPRNPDLLYEAGLLSKKLGKIAESVSYLKQAAEVNPNAKMIRFEYTVAIMDSGDLAGAEEEARKWLKKNPRDFAFNNLLGVILRKQTRYHDALVYLKAARKTEPKNSAPLVNLGNVYLDMGDGKNAEEIYLQIIRAEPKNAEHARMLGRAYMAEGEYPKSLVQFRRSLTLNPANIDAMNDLIKALSVTGEYNAALAEADNRLALYPDNIQLMSAKAWVLHRLGKIEEAAALYERILEISPANVEILMNLGRLYEKFDREKANGYYRRALVADNRSVKTLGALCESLNRSRYGSEAAHIQESYELAVEIIQKSGTAPLYESSIIRNIFLRCVDYENLGRIDLAKCRDYWLKRMNIGAFHLELSRVKTYEDRLQVIRYHREWGKKIEAQAANMAVKRPARAPRDKIRVGFMSSDLRAHPVTYFALPLLEYYDKNRFEVYCYSFYAREADRTQEHIMKSVDAFRWWPKNSDQEITQGIADDNLDIIFELGGTTDMNKLEILAAKPVPVQASWLGYPHSAGLSTLDYILVDPYIKPEDPKLLIEKPFIMPETWVSLGRSGFFDVPINPQIPAERNGFITFGTMNNPYKYTAEAIATWAEILKQVPGSKFLFVRPEGDVPAFRANVEMEFSKHGVPAERILYIPVRGKHMPHYNDIDIALDSFPHVGGTTTCETIWMGVPVITLVGPAFFERLSYSNLSNAGLGEFCAFTLEDYIKKAVALAGDKEKLKYLRNNLRAQILQHPLGQTQRFADNFYKMVEKTLA